MNRSIKLAVHGTVLAAALVLGAPQAFAVSVPEGARTAQGPVDSSAAAWTPPEGYTRVDTFYGGAECHAAGKSGVAEGRWSAYLCVQEFPYTPFQSLYVRK